MKEIFKATQDLQLEIREKQIPNMPMMDLSMGMSRDYKEAIEFGSTLSELVQSFLIGKKYVFKDRFDKFIDYFTEDGEDVGTIYQPKAEEPIVTPVPSVQELPQQAGSAPSKIKHHPSSCPSTRVGYAKSTFY